MYWLTWAEVLLIVNYAIKPWQQLLVGRRYGFQLQYTSTYLCCQDNFCPGSLISRTLTKRSIGISQSSSPQVDMTVKTAPRIYCPKILRLPFSQEVHPGFHSICQASPWISWSGVVVLFYEICREFVRSATADHWNDCWARKCFIWWALSVPQVFFL